MTQITKEKILETLKTVMDGDQNIVAKNMVQGLQVQDGHVIFTIVVDPQVGAQAEPIRVEAEQKVHALDGVLSGTVVLTADKTQGSDTGHTHEHEHAHPHTHAQAAPQPRDGEAKAPLLPDVKVMIAVASGKGGVGKSTTTVNLALALRDQGLKVGVLDADIYGPSMPRMLGIKGEPSSSDGKLLDPLKGHGITCMSMGFLVEEETPIIWRGPMAQSALLQMMRDVKWGELDVLMIDMPPGTGDVQLTLAQQVPLTGAVIVSTPQDIALLDARKGLNMFRQVDVPVLGIIENMSYFKCPHCGERTDVFSHGGARQEAEKLQTHFLGEIPLDIQIRETSDKGHPIVDANPDSPHAKAYKAIAAKIWEQANATLAAQASATPKIVQ